MYPQFPGSAWLTPYGLTLVLASAAAWWWARCRAKRRHFEASHIDLLVPVALLLGILGARFLTNLLPGDSLSIGEGYRVPFRLQLFGLLAAALPAVLLYAHVAHLPKRRLLDVVALPALLWVAVLRVGCFLAGCCWGDVVLSSNEAVRTEPDLQMRTVSGLDELARHVAVNFPAHSFAWDQHYRAGLLPAGATTSLPVHPVQLYEAGAVLALLLILRGAEQGRQPGLTALYVLGAYALVRFFIEFLRADNPLVLGILTLNQLICVMLIAFCAAGKVMIARLPAA